MENIVLINKSYLDGASKLISSIYFKPYRYLSKEIPNDKLNRYMNKQIRETFSDKSIDCYIFLRKGEVLGLGFLEELRWDSAIFGIKMARVRSLVSNDTLPDAARVKNKLLEFFINECANKRIRHLSCKVNSDDFASIHALERNGFKLMDTLLDYVFDYRKYSVKDINPPCIIRPFKEEDIDGISRVAKTAFSNHFGRFNVDKRLTKKAVELYSEWAKNSCQGFGDNVFVAELNKRIVGYSVWKILNWSKEVLGISIGLYSIAAVSPDAYGRGIFKAITLAGMKWLEEKVDIIEGPTHINNYAVQRGYATLMWRIVDAQHTFHKWIK